MSVTGLSASSLYSAAGNQTGFQQIQQDFQQLGQDLQAGNLSQAQQDYATLTAALPANQQQNNNNPIAQAFAQLGQALQSGDLSTAQQAFATIQQDFQQNQGAQGHHRHHAHGNQGGGNSGQDSTIGQELSALGQALQNGDVNSAQQVFSSLTQILDEQFGTYVSNGFSASTASSTTGSTLNVSA
ncbi:MAG TPA: hypothetical protein VMU43_06195 [Candidatus Acidoferrum sp.]|nr:hypothetical protein [Candidatus Acidoferrum sp.]